jgi:hypothetical protein
VLNVSVGNYHIGELAAGYPLPVYHFHPLHTGVININFRYFLPQTELDALRYRQSVEGRHNFLKPTQGVPNPQGEVCMTHEMVDRWNAFRL